MECLLNGDALWCRQTVNLGSPPASASLLLVLQAYATIPDGSLGYLGIRRNYVHKNMLLYQAM